MSEEAKRLKQPWAFLKFDILSILAFRKFENEKRNKNYYIMEENKNIDLYNNEIKQVYEILKEHATEIMVCRKFNQSTDIDFQQAVQIPSSRTNFLVFAGVDDMYSICYKGIPQMIEHKLYKIIVK